MRLGRSAAVAVLAGFALLAANRADAGIITFDFRGTPGTAFPFAGNFANDNDVALIYFTLTGASDLVASTSSAAAGGFDPYLALFDSTGNWLIDNDDDPNDPAFGLDSRLSSADLLGALLAPGDYILALTQSLNYAHTALAGGLGFDMADTPQFTCADPAAAAGCFTDWTGQARTSAFAGSLTVLPLTPTTPVPESGTLALTLAGLVAAFSRRRAMSP